MRIQNNDKRRAVSAFFLKQDKEICLILGIKKVEKDLRIVYVSFPDERDIKLREEKNIKVGADFVKRSISECIMHDSNIVMVVHNHLYGPPIFSGTDIVTNRKWKTYILDNRIKTIPASGVFANGAISYSIYFKDKTLRKYIERWENEVY